MRWKSDRRALGDAKGNGWERREEDESGAREGRDWGEVRVMGCRGQMSSSKNVMCTSLKTLSILAKL